MDFTIFRGINNAPDAVDIRKEVFIKEQHFENEFDDIDNNAFHILVYDGALPVGTGRLYTENGSEYFIGRVAVISSYRKKGIGRIIVSELEKKAAESGADRISLSAQVRASDFYKSLGYIAEDDVYFDEYCPHIRMFKNINTL